MDDKNEVIEQPTEQVTTTAIVEAPAQKAQFVSIWNDDKSMKRAYAAAKYLSQSDFVPAMYRNKPENCLIALDLAYNTQQPPLTVMQNLYVVQGKPAWSGAMCIALVNSRGGYSKPLSFVYVGEAGKPSYGCFAKTVDFDGNEVIGTTVTMQLAQDEGWIQKSGSKWKTMPDQMLAYRAGAFFARANCPEVLFGLPTIEEVKDVNGWEEDKKEKTVITIDGAIFTE